MTRGQDQEVQNQSLQPQSSTESIPDAILTLTKNVLGQNVEKTIEPLIKRVGSVETSEKIENHDNSGEEKKKKRKADPKKENNKTEISTTSIRKLNKN